MRESLRRFAFTLIFIALVFTVLGYGVFLFIAPAQYFPYFPVVPAFLLLVTLLVHIYLIRASENDARKFTARYLGAMGLKMFIYLIFLVVVLSIDTARAVPFLVSFLACYAAFTTHEVISILNYLKKDK